MRVGRRSLATSLLIAPILTFGFGGASMAPAYAAPEEPKPVRETKQPPLLPGAADKTELKSLTGYKLTTSSWITLEPGRREAAYTICPSDMVIMGGGAFSSSSGGVVLTDSYPIFDGSWLGAARNDSSSAASMLVFGICGKGIGSYRRTFASATTGPISRGRNVALCGPAMSVLGGGVGTNNPRGIAITDMYPETGAHHTYWVAGIRNNTSGPVDFHTWAVCGSGLSGQQALEYYAGDVAPGGYKSGHADCPAGKSIISGGVDNTFSGGLTVTDSFPSGNGWTVYVRNDSGTGQQFSVYINCGS